VTQIGGALSELGSQYDEVFSALAIGEHEDTSHSSNWYAIQTAPRHEKKVEFLLREKGISVFLPAVRAERQWSDRKRSITLPLFAGYVFVQTEAHRPSRVFILRTPGVHAFVGNSGMGTAIPGQEIESVRTAIRSGVHCRPHPFVAVGQRVRIQGGALEGMEGILLEQHPDNVVVISVNLIQRSMAIRTAGYRILPI
jgi:transcription antitermination factor NusG